MYIVLLSHMILSSTLYTILSIRTVISKLDTTFVLSDDDLKLELLDGAVGSDAIDRLTLAYTVVPVAENVLLGTPVTASLYPVIGYKMTLSRSSEKDILLRICFNMFFKIIFQSLCHTHRIGIESLSEHPECRCVFSTIF